MQTEAPSEMISPLAEIVRGDLVESQHLGSVAVVDGLGNILATAGRPDTLTFLRSSAKPFQAIPLVSSGAADRFGFSNQEIAIACGSHNGEPIHTRTVESMLRKIGMSSSDLKCGLHEPYNKAVADEQRRLGLPPTVLQNNCSGKHAGMLCLAQFLNEPVGDYLSPQHKIQQSIRTAVAEFASLPLEAIQLATDGCGAPTFAVSVRVMASMFARLFCSTKVSDASGIAAARIARAMTAHPEYVGGDHEFDTELMRETHGRIVAKMGAEGIWCAGIAPNPDWPNGCGVAVKIEDGSARARPVIGMEILRQLNLLNETESKALTEFSSRPIRNNVGLIVGSIRSSVRLHLP